MKKIFNTLVVTKVNSNFKYSIEKKNISDLPKGDVVIEVYYSSLNYKDVLSCKGDVTVTRHYPHTPGIDAAGIVAYSSSRNFKKNDRVIVISFDLGANTDGGFSEFIRVPADWVMKLPSGLTLKESMIYGTAGFTAALAVFYLKKNLPKNEKKILVTGATGGVGSLAISFLSKLGYSITASTGKDKKKNFLKKIGANEIINRNDLIDRYGMTLMKENWSGAIDTVGGQTLEFILKTTKKRGVVISAGMVSSARFSNTVYPFILRGINLIGTGASEISMVDRKKIWKLISKEWKIDNLNQITTQIKLSEIPDYIENFLTGKQTGRVVVKIKQ